MKSLAPLLPSVLFLCCFSGAFAAESVTIEITSNDQMQYDVKAFEVTEGQKVTLVFKHKGQLPAVAMGHNVVILKPGTPLPTFAAAAAQAKDNDYIPLDENKDAIVVHTKMLGGGETDTVTFTAPAPGEYPYVCSFPGHFAIMQGLMTVKSK